MQLQKIRNQLWVVSNGEPLRQAQESEIKRWATLRLIEALKEEREVIEQPDRKVA